MLNGANLVFAHDDLSPVGGRWSVVGRRSPHQRPLIAAQHSLDHPPPGEHIERPGAASRAHTLAQRRIAEQRADALGHRVRVARRHQIACLTITYHLGQTADQASWLIGEGIFTDAVEGRALRSMAAPGTAYDDDVLGRDPQPAHMRDFVVTRDDNGGVHINSGIPNHAFYLVATALGGYAWERAGLIWYRALTGALPSTADFSTFANATLAAAAAEYGEESEEVAAVRAAWTSVGVIHDARAAETAA